MPTSAESVVASEEQTCAGASEPPSSPEAEGEPPSSDAEGEPPSLPVHPAPADLARDEPRRATRAARPPHYKIVETSTVTDESLEEIVNGWVAEGWTFDGFHFAMRESSKRPAMAFVVFTRSPQAVSTGKNGNAERERSQGHFSPRG